MSKIERSLPDDWHPDTWSLADHEQEEDLRAEQREASGLVSFVAISLFLGVACGWAGILTGRI